MDPNETLAKARRAAQDFRGANAAAGVFADSSDRLAVIQEAEPLAEAFEALDEWLSKGGFLPAGWSRKQDELILFVRALATAPICNGSSEHMLRRLEDIRNAAIALLSP